MSDVKRAKRESDVLPAFSFSPGVKSSKTQKEKLPAGVPARVFRELDEGKSVSIKLGVHGGRITMNVISAFKSGKIYDARVETTEAHMASIEDDERRDSVELFMEEASKEFNRVVKEFNEAGAKGDLDLIKQAYEKLYDDVNLRNVLGSCEPITSCDSSTKFVRGVGEDVLGQVFVYVRAPKTSEAWKVARALVDARNETERARAMRAVHEYNRDPRNALTADLALGFVNTAPIAVVKVSWGFVVPRSARQF